MNSVAELPARANFAYIDAKVEDVLKTRIEPTQAERLKAAQIAKKHIAGFEVHDEQAERTALDRMVAANGAKLAQFRKDRAEVREKFAELGLTPLAVAPLVAWNEILKTAGLIRMSPDANGRVAILRSAVRSFGSAKEAVRVAERNYVGYVRALFPEGVDAYAASMAWRTRLSQLGGWGERPHLDVRVILPEPPQDVVDVLVKAQGLELRTAAVPEAITIGVSPTALWNEELRVGEEERRRIEALRADPIIYHEHGSAAAVVAQFGDFPIEQKIVDAAVKLDMFDGGKLPASVYTGVDHDYRAMMAQQLAMAQNAGQAQAGRMFGPSNLGLFG